MIYTQNHKFVSQKIYNQFLANDRVMGAHISHVFNRHQQHPTSGPGSRDVLRVHESRGMNFKASKV